MPKVEDIYDDQKRRQLHLADAALLIMKSKPLRHSRQSHCVRD